MFSDKLKELRRRNGLTQTELANILGISKSAIANYELGIRMPGQNSAWKKIADYFNVSIDYLMDYEAHTGDEYPETIASSTGSIDDIFPTDTPKNIVTSDIQASTDIKVPILGEVAAGMGVYADNNIVGYENIPQEWMRDSDDYVLLQVKGDSMYPEFHENDLLLIKCQPVVDSGDYAVVLIDNDNGVVKRVIQGNGWIEMRSVNPIYPPRRFNQSEMERLRIFGLVKRVIRKY